MTFGRLLLRNGQEAQALRWLASALQEDPDHAAARQALDEYVQRTGDREGAARVLGAKMPH